MKELSLLAVAGALFVGGLTSEAQAATFTTSGLLTSPPVGAYELFVFDVDVAGTTTLQLSSDSDAFLGLFSGNSVLDNSTFISQDDDSGGGLNSFLSSTLSIGTYTAWITSHGSYWDTGSNAIATDHDHLPMNYTLTINTDISGASTVPLPAAAPLLGGGLGLLGFFGWRKKRKAAA
ncbi:PEP-CTERM sorting domain-containing protein [Salipiger sp.]|uniref:PEP-CTERM sorting domain-containing protein n=1 Tax=Salipiger sp. TaxID=2078585 RepID=UPI003A9782E5